MVSNETMDGSQKRNADSARDAAAKPTFLPIGNNVDYALRQLALIFFSLQDQLYLLRRWRRLFWLVPYISFEKYLHCLSRHTL